jgi:hypothetical protein
MGTCQLREKILRDRQTSILQDSWGLMWVLTDIDPPGSLGVDVGVDNPTKKKIFITKSERTSRPTRSCRADDYDDVWLSS